MFNRNFIILLFVSGCQNIQNQIINPIITKYSRSLGFDLALSVYVFGFFAVGSLLSRVTSSKILNFKKTIAFSSILMSICCVLYTFSGLGFWFMFILRAVHGSSFAFFTTSIMSYTSYFIKEENMSKGMAYLGLGQVISVAIGPIISFYVLGIVGYTPLFLTACGISLLSFILCLFVKPIKISQKNKGFICTKILNISFLAMLLFLINSIETAFIVLYSEKLEIKNVIFYFIISAFSMLISRLYITKFYADAQIKPVLITSFILISTAFSCLIGANFYLKDILFFSSAFLKGCSHAVILSVLQGRSLKKVTLAQRTNASATFYMGCDLGIILAPMLTSTSHDNYIYIFTLGVILSLISAIYVFINKL